MHKNKFELWWATPGRNFSEVIEQVVQSFSKPSEDKLLYWVWAEPFSLQKDPVMDKVSAMCGVESKRMDFTE